MAGVLRGSGGFAEVVGWQKKKKKKKAYFACHRAYSAALHQGPHGPVDISAGLVCGVLKRARVAYRIMFVH